jgi:hypothetical protein
LDFDVPEKVTIQMIAQECEVSPTTVSLVLNHKPGVSGETRSRVLEAAQALGYKQSLTPSKKISRKLSTVGIVVKTEPDLLPPSNPFYSQIIAGVDDACSLQISISTVPKAKKKPFVYFAKIHSSQRYLQSMTMLPWAQSVVPSGLGARSQMIYP